MKIAVISDIHGNMEAFARVLEDIDEFGVDAVYCLGDNIGYGPEPDQVVQMVRSREISTVMGNHEWAVTDHNHLNWFNPVARKSLRHTMKMLSRDSIRYIRKMKTSMVHAGCRFVHGFPPDSVNTYMFHVPNFKLTYILKQLNERICFVGHTHDLEIVSFDGTAVHRAGLRKGTVKLIDNRRYLINIGSVGQPRDENNNAKYVIFDTVQETLEVRFIPYDIASVVEKILEAGLPEGHATRLW